VGLDVVPPKGLEAEKPRFYFVIDPDGYLIEVVRRDIDTGEE
jgi:lactoylglutathione lyase